MATMRASCWKKSFRLLNLRKQLTAAASVFQKMEMTAPLADRAAVQYVHSLPHGNAPKSLQKYSAPSAHTLACVVPTITIFLCANMNPNPSASFYRMAPTTSTSMQATGGKQTKQWNVHSPLPAMM